ncbi:hypothetical protein [Nonomuraea sp. NPDC003201]
MPTFTNVWNAIHDTSAPASTEYEQPPLGRPRPQQRPGHHGREHQHRPQVRLQRDQPDRPDRHGGQHQRQHHPAEPGPPLPVAELAERHREGRRRRHRLLPALALP